MADLKEIYKEKHFILRKCRLPQFEWEVILVEGDEFQPAAISELKYIDKAIHSLEHGA